MTLGVKVILVNPHHHSGQADNLHGDDRRNLTRRHLAACQLPERTWDAEGREVRCPAAWKA